MSDYGFAVADLVQKGRLKFEDIAVIKQWVISQRFPSYPDETLALFFLACQNDMEATKKCARAYYQARKDAPELFNDRQLFRSDIQHQLRILNFCIFPKRTDEGYVIINHRLVDFDASQYHMEVAMKVLFMTIDAAVFDEPPTGVIGIITLFDMRGVGLRHLTRIKIGAIKKFFHYTQEALPLRLVKIHVMNAVWFFDKIYKIIKPFMKPELQKDLHLHTSGIDMENFYMQYIPKKCLPCDYGGDLPCVDELQKETYKKLEEMQQFFEKEQQLRSV